MSASNLRKSLKDLTSDFYNRHSGLIQKLNAERPHFADLRNPVQEAEISKGRSDITADSLNKLASIQRDIAGEKQANVRSIGKLKYPNLTNIDSNAARGFGETQLMSARFFLGSSPSDEALSSEIHNAFDLGRIDYAWTLLEGSRPATPTNRALSDAEKKRIALLDEIENALPEKAKLNELQAELRSNTSVAQKAREFQKYVQSGYQNEFFTREDVESMPQNVVQANLISVNESMSCWEQSLVAT